MATVPPGTPRAVSTEDITRLLLQFFPPKSVRIEDGKSANARTMKLFLVERDLHFEQFKLEILAQICQIVYQTKNTSEQTQKIKRKMTIMSNMPSSPYPHFNHYFSDFD